MGLEVAEFSNSGAVAAAPGVGIVSARAGGGLIAFDGTSAAVPHAAGVAALWAEKLMRNGAFDASSFPSHVLSSASRHALARTCAPNAVGAGIVRAPQS